MRSFKILIRNFFGFSRSQTNGFVILLPVVTLALFSEPTYRWWVSQRKDDFSKEKLALDSLTSQWELEKEKNQIPLEEEVAFVFFKFDPNAATSEELNALGFSKGLTQRLIHYREKGGKFRVKTDLRKLYGMDSLFYESLTPFILLPEKIELVKKESDFTKSFKKKSEIFDINEADSTQWKSIYGIGSKLSKRIIVYREKLGGFITQNQLNEVYGLDSVVIDRINKASFLSAEFSPNKIYVNTADELVLSSHPYLTKKLAKAIVAYRFQHGKFHSLEDLRKVQLIDNTVLEKISPYLTFEQ
jgi:competence ComEA-like helix-hairpin-helix protein